MTLHCQ